MASKKTAPKTKTKKETHPSVVIQMGIVFLMIAAFALVAYAVKNFT